MQALQDKKYAGWMNYDTWNVAFYINNEQRLSEIAKRCDCYDEFAYYMQAAGYKKTPDGVSWSSKHISRRELNEEIFNKEEQE